MRLIDAAIKDLEMIEDCRTCLNKNPFCDSNPDSCSGYKWRGVSHDATDDNQPLTLEELREMDDVDVWIAYPPDLDGDGLVIHALVEYDIESGDVWLTNNLGGRSTFNDVSDGGGIAYRRRPEASANA